MANRILEIHLAPGADGSKWTHIERVRWAYEFVLDAVNNDPREVVAQRIRAGQDLDTCAAPRRRLRARLKPEHRHHVTLPAQRTHHERKTRHPFAGSAF